MMDHTKYFSELVLKPGQFNHPSQLHGIGHTYRVMLLVYKLCNLIDKNKLMKPTIAAAFIHDMARQHDGYCTAHGLWAVEQKLPLYRSFFYSFDISKTDLDLMATAIQYHSLTVELDFNHPAYLMTAIVKDADALDRIRLSDVNLDKSYLRFSESNNLIEFAREFYFATRNLNFYNFAEVIEFAELINQK